MTLLSLLIKLATACDAGHVCVGEDYRDPSKLPQSIDECAVVEGELETFDGDLYSFEPEEDTSVRLTLTGRGEDSCPRGVRLRLESGDEDSDTEEPTEGGCPEIVVSLRAGQPRVLMATGVTEAPFQYDLHVEYE